MEEVGNEEEIYIKHQVKEKESDKEVILDINIKTDEDGGSQFISIHWYGVIPVPKGIMVKAYATLPMVE